ncbi:uncharacterized protein E0L32_009114 [Thyridium curvatum]|uniref:C6 zinc finger domain protein n=1 Tax=Thyridium curvatum TaxID=1093900 RepID=A0A507AXJ0_9PEZI|nr:uncharacterized protein E0L32_009114 [Thyridium curvatum]TPX09641.1 hypothetical protein E0L32_009114 [Thyridium curvatum]
MIYQPSAGLPFSEQDGLYFSLFRSHTANELSGFFDNVFWSRIVMQECHSEPAIRHAVVALGALYKTLEKATESPPSSPTDSGLLMDSAHRHWEVALKQYSKALEASISASRQDVGAHRTVLMASVLLACFDSFVGDHKKAILQIQQGLRFLESLRAERRRSFAPKPEEPVEDEIIQMFTRLAIQAKSYDMAFHFPQPHVIRLLPSPTDPLSPAAEGTSPVSIHQEPIPPQFPSLLDARIAWDTLLERVFRFTELMFQFVSAGSAPNILPNSMTQYGQQFQADLRAWSDAFEPLLSSRFAPSVTRQEKAGIAVLKMFHLMGEILFAMTFSDSEMHFDKYRPHFKTIVDLAQEVVGDEERSAKEKRCPNPGRCTHQRNHPPDVFGGNDYAAHHIKASFSADLGIVPPLYVVATKSRDRQIRRQAIQLLRSSSRREGMWDSELMARIGMWVTEIEEEEELLTPRESPVAFSRPFSDAGSPNGSLDFGERPLGPGGNAKWEDRRESIVSTLSNRSQPKPIPAEKRVLVKSCEFDLREHKAVLQCGTRGLAAGSLDLKTRRTTISW